MNALTLVEVIEIVGTVYMWVWAFYGSYLSSGAALGFMFFIFVLIVSCRIWASVEKRRKEKMKGESK